jgi:protein gp37
MMYEWITKKWTPVGGACPIACPYCLVNSYKKRFPQHRAKYSGEPRLVGPWPKFKKGDVVFVCHMTDLFAMPDEVIGAVMDHCCRFPKAHYVFQTKQPENVAQFRYVMPWPSQRTIGTTVEADDTDDRLARLSSIDYLGRFLGERTFVTVEPIHRFSGGFAQRLIAAHPFFVNIGADSKHSGLPEPTADEVRKLIADLRAAGIEVREKANLKRILEA